MGGEGGAPQGQRGAFSELPHGIHPTTILSDNSWLVSQGSEFHSDQDWTFTHLFGVRTGSGSEPAGYACQMPTRGQT